jgi:hypothetical protein
MARDGGSFEGARDVNSTRTSRARRERYDATSRISSNTSSSSSTAADTAVVNAVSMRARSYGGDAAAAAAAAFEFEF